MPSQSYPVSRLTPICQSHWRSLWPFWLAESLSYSPSVRYLGAMDTDFVGIELLSVHFFELSQHPISDQKMELPGSKESIFTIKITINKINKQILEYRKFNHNTHLKSPMATRKRTLWSIVKIKWWYILLDQQMPMHIFIFNDCIFVCNIQYRPTK